MFCVLNEDLTRRHVGQVVWFDSSLGPVAASTEVSPNTKMATIALIILTRLRSRMTNSDVLRFGSLSLTRQCMKSNQNCIAIPPYYLQSLFNLYACVSYPGQYLNTR